jgi:hypothetical protein
MATAEFERRRLGRAEHQLYSPHLKPCDFWLFGFLKEKLKDRQLRGVQSLHHVITDLWDELTSGLPIASALRSSRFTLLRTGLSERFESENTLDRCEMGCAWRDTRVIASTIPAERQILKSPGFHLWRHIAQFSKQILCNGNQTTNPDVMLMQAIGLQWKAGCQGPTYVNVFSAEVWHSREDQLRECLSKSSDP